MDYPESPKTAYGLKGTDRILEALEEQDRTGRTG